MANIEDAMREFEKNTNEIKKIAKKIANEELNKRFCNKLKEIGDKVMVWGASFCQDIETKKDPDFIKDMCKYPMIIIEKGCTNEYYDEIVEKKFNRDIVVYSPRYNKKIATCMKYVRLVE